MARSWRARGFRRPEHQPSDRHDGNSSHPGSQGPKITRVSGQQTNATAKPTRGDGDDRVDGVVPAGATQHLAGGAASLRRHRLLFDAGQQAMDTGVPAVTTEDLGQGHGAHVYACADLLGDGQLRPHPHVALSAGAERCRVENDRSWQGPGPQGAALASASHWRRTSSITASGIGPFSAS